MKKVMGDEALKMMNRGTKTVEVVHTGTDTPWGLGTGEEWVTYWTVDGVKYRQYTDRDGWAELEEVK